MRKLFAFLFCALLSTATMFADGPFRNHRYDSFKVLETNSESIVFIGNSITDMHCWPEAFVTSDGNYLPIVNRGNSGTYSTEQSDNLESYIAGKPKKVFMMIGTNDIAISGGLNFSGEQVLAYVKSIVERIHARSPQTKVYLYSILKNNTSNRVEATWLHTNEIVKNYVETMNVDWLTYIDLYDKLAGIAQGGVWSYDYLHLTAAAYQVWCETICQYLQEGEDYTVSTVYPGNTSSAQQNGSLGSAHGMRATYFSMLPINNEDVLVFGDEFIKNGEWQELLGNRNVKNRGTGWGYGGDIATTSKIVDATYANTGVEKKDAKAIFIYTGTGDCNGSTAIETVKSNYKALVDKVAQKSPTSKIYLMALAPTNNATTNTSRIAVLNSYMQSLATGNIRYVDTYTPLLNGNVANTKYFYPSNYLGGLGYVVMANAMKDALKADFPADTYTAISEADAEARYAQATLRNTLSQVIARGLIMERGDAMGQYDTEKMKAFDAELENAYALLAKESITEDEIQAMSNKLNDILKEAIAMPKASTANDEYWYQFTSLRSNNLYISAEGQATGVVGKENTAASATSMWKFVDRGDNTFDIINREYKSYLNPVATYNTQITTTTSKPSKGWTVNYADTPAYYIISSGDVQLNQTGSGQSFKIYNWSNSNTLGYDRGDTGCQLSIVEAAEIAELPSILAYTVDKNNGSLYHANGSANQSWNCCWKSNATPQLQFGCGTINNMNWQGNNVQLMTGTAGSANYALTAPAGYVITEYSFTFANTNGHNTGLTLTMDNGKVYTTSSAAQTISTKNIKASSVSFTLAGSNGNGVVLTNFTAKIKEDKIESPSISTEGDVHWYYISSASTKAYCSGKVIYYDNDMEKLRFGDKTFSADRIWSFWEKDGKLTIKNYKGGSGLPFPSPTCEKCK